MKNRTNQYRELLNTCQQYGIDSLEAHKLFTNPNRAINANGRTLLHCAAEENRLDILNTLFQYRELNIDQVDHSGDTALILAAKHGHINSVKTLLKQQANVNLSNDQKDDYTALLWAVQHGHIEIAQMLLHHGADVSAVTKTGQTALHFAASKGRTEIVKVLLSYGAKPNALSADENQYTPLHWAAMHGHTDIATLLIEHGANLNIRDNRCKYTPLHWAVTQGHAAIVNRLLSHGADSGIVDEDGYSALSWARQEGHTKMVKKLEILNTPLDAPYLGNDISYPHCLHRYNKQIIIDYMQDGFGAEMLKQKWDIKHPEQPCIIIKSHEFEKMSESLLQPHDIARIYIHAHGSSGSDYLSSDLEANKEAPKIHFNKLAEKLVNFIGTNAAAVNLLACSGGKGNRESLQDNRSADSFAAKLHDALSTKSGRDIPVVARTNVAWHFLDKVAIVLKKTLNLDIPIHDCKNYFDKKNENWLTKQPGSKVYYTRNNSQDDPHHRHNTQLRIDAYSHKWKEKVISELTIACKKTKMSDKKISLQQWIWNFEKMNPKEIFTTLQKELNDPQSVIKKHFSPPYSPARLFRTATDKKFEELIMAGKKYFDSKYTMGPIETGKSFNPYS